MWVVIEWAVITIWLHNNIIDLLTTLKSMKIHVIGTWTSLLTWQLPVIKPYSFAKFQELIAVQTGVSAAQQKLFFKYDEFKPDPMAPSSSYPKTSVSMRTSNKVPSHIFILGYGILLCPSIHQLICLLLSGPT